MAIDANRARQARSAEVWTDMGTFPAGDDYIDRVLAGEVLRPALARLSQEHRSVIIEVYFRGRSASETAALFGLGGRHLY